MILCLVTDRRRLASGATAEAERSRLLRQQAIAAVAAGVDYLLVREPDLEARALAALVSDLLALTRASRTRLLVNERLDVALACGADGVHLRESSFAAADARRLAPPRFLIGRSVHSVGAATAATGADYLIAGTAFETPSKPPHHDLLGVDGIRAIATAVAIPVLAIGGVTEHNAAEIATAGAAGAAAIGLFMPASALASRVGDARARFDSVWGRP